MTLQAFMLIHATTEEPPRWDSPTLCGAYDSAYSLLAPVRVREIERATCRECRHIMFSKK